MNHWFRGRPSTVNLKLSWTKPPILGAHESPEWKFKKLIDLYYDKEDEIRKVEGYSIQQYSEKGYQLVNTQKVPKSTFKVTIESPGMDATVTQNFILKDKQYNYNLCRRFTNIKCEKLSTIFRSCFKMEVKIDCKCLIFKTKLHYFFVAKATVKIIS